MNFVRKAGEKRIDFQKLVSLFGALISFALLFGPFLKYSYLTYKDGVLVEAKMSFDGFSFFSYSPYFSLFTRVIGSLYVVCLLIFILGYFLRILADREIPFVSTIAIGLLILLLEFLISRLDFCGYISFFLLLICHFLDFWLKENKRKEDMLVFILVSAAIVFFLPAGYLVSDLLG